MKIREINKSDPAELREVFRIQRAAYEVEAKLLRAKSFHPLKETFDRFQCSTDLGIVAIMESALVGAIFLELSKESVLISKLVVDPGFFRRGVGRNLISHCLSAYPAREFYVGTGIDNAPAINLYQSFGFRIYEERKVDGGLKVVKLRRSIT